MGLMRKLAEALSGTRSDQPGRGRCPSCGDALRRSDVGEYGSVALDVCPNCRGTWFDAGELDQLDGSVWANVEHQAFREVAPDHPRAACPRCEIPLEAVAPAEVEVTVDRCPACHGFWLDAGELDRMRDLAARTDAKAVQPVGNHKPAGWSELRWRMYLLQRHRGANP